MRAHGCHATRSAWRRSGSFGSSAWPSGKSVAKGLKPALLLLGWKPFHALLNHFNNLLRYTLCRDRLPRLHFDPLALICHPSPLSASSGPAGSASLLADSTRPHHPHSLALQKVVKQPVRWLKVLNASRGIRMGPRPSSQLETRGGVHQGNPSTAGGGVAPAHGALPEYGGSAG